jgi:cell division septation protein DedD
MPRRQRATIEFSAIQLATLGGCVLGATTIVFLLGIYVGRGLPAHHAGIDEQVARIPVAEPPAVLPVARGPVPDPLSEPPKPDLVGLSPPVAEPSLEEIIAGESAPQKPLAEAAPQLPVVPSVPYTVQVLATRNKDEAETLAAGLKKRRIGAFVSEVEDTAGSWYRVRIGIYDDLESAQVMETRLRNLGLQQAYVSRYR